MLVYLMAFFGMVLIVVGIIAIMLRSRGRYVRPSREEDETIAGLDKAFGQNMRWGKSGGTESELHDRAEHSAHSSGGESDGDGD